jgi:phage terminase large subunit
MIHSRVYKETMSAMIDTNYNLIVNQGGTSSSKTYSEMQLLKDIAVINDQGLLISVLSHSVPHLKMGVIRDAENICRDEGVPFDYNISDKILQIGKSKIEFISADKMKAHGGRRDILFINEANALSFEVFRQMYIRTRIKTIIDFNPALEFWYNTEIENNPIQQVISLKPYRAIEALGMNVRLEDDSPIRAAILDNEGNFVQKILLDYNYYFEKL